MILKNKRTRETLNITLTEFKIRFVKEIKMEFESYKQTELAKPYFRTKNIDESDFYFDLQWNFNHHASSDWYIKSIL
jgi:hypothetical protein